jgi:hypothetical protein
MAVDPKPFQDLGYTTTMKAETELSPGEWLYVGGLGQHYQVTEANYDASLADATQVKGNRDQLKAAWNTFHNNFDNWPTMTAGQKDTANRQAQRALAHLIRNFAEDA